ncbi:hypothetical protein HMPREF1531_01677 [Propionibacterium sp. oral taxon 192 str. F0372]|uniref:hypothetical protein n=1 Tax=Propionibacterium sp. oral taxon 192 TaxID=671222 RepID=UPI000352A1AA|nr:hypothetical protein [Propionibacterium sp. oral taxon 192]EPH02371.1 hypothetical protein HMPREF1531_01677 [Propionibacterium sp. oral taxon 192 str. F0372]
MSRRPRVSTLAWAAMFALVALVALFQAMGAAETVTELVRTGVPVLLIVLGLLGLWSSRTNQ